MNSSKIRPSRLGRNPFIHELKFSASEKIKVRKFKNEIMNSIYLCPRFFSNMLELNVVVSLLLDRSRR